MQKKQSIFDIADDFEALWEMMEDLDGDITEDPQTFQAYKDFCEELETNLKTKADSYARIITDANAKADSIEAEIVRLRKLKSSHVKKSQKLKELLFFAMEKTGQVKFETDLHKFAIQKAGGKQKLDVTVPPEELPEQYQMTLIDADKEALRHALAAGKEIPGVVLMERGSYLRIR